MVSDGYQPQEAVKRRRQTDRRDCLASFEQIFLFLSKARRDSPAYCPDRPVVGTVVSDPGIAVEKSSGFDAGGLKIPSSVLEAFSLGEVCWTALSARAESRQGCRR